jgi:hypothetical protein
MAEFFYILYTVLYIGLLVYTALVYRQTRRLTSLLIGLNAFGLLWENGVIASGSFIGAGPLLQALNMGRYCLHFALVPPLAWALLEQVRLAGHPWAGTKLARGLTLALILGLIAFGFLAGAPGLFPRLAPVTLEGALRYTAPNRASAPIAIVIMTVALAAGLVLWTKNKWPWLFLSALLAFAVEGALRNFELLSLVAGNGAEVLFQIALLQTELLVTKQELSRDASPHSGI